MTFECTLSTAGSNITPINRVILIEIELHHTR